jgi:4-hydroxy-2-oxoglutarate aldolase
LFRSARHEEAQALQQRLAIASKAIVSDGGIAGVKFAMDLRGYNGGKPRPPLLPIDEKVRARIEQIVPQFEAVVARA